MSVRAVARASEKESEKDRRIGCEVEGGAFRVMASATTVSVCARMRATGHRWPREKAGALPTASPSPCRVVCEMDKTEVEDEESGQLRRSQSTARRLADAQFAPTANTRELDPRPRASPFIVVELNLELQIDQLQLPPTQLPSQWCARIAQPRTKGRTDTPHSSVHSSAQACSSQLPPSFSTTPSGRWSWYAAFTVLQLVVLFRLTCLLVAICRLFAPFSVALPSPCLGHPSPRHPHLGRRCRRWLFPVSCHDQKQPQKGSQGPAKKGHMMGGLLHLFETPAPFFQTANKTHKLLIHYLLTFVSLSMLHCCMPCSD